MKKNTMSYLIIFLLVLSLNLQAETTQKNTKLIAVMLPFTSAFNKIAVEQQNAIDLLTSKYPEYKVVYLDSKGDASGAVETFNSLLEMEVLPFALISCASWVATALHPLAADAGIFHIVIGSANFDRKIPHRTVRFTLDGKQEEKQLANYLNEFDRIAIYSMDNSYGNGWKNILEKNMTNKIIKAISYDPLKKDFQSDLKEIKKETPDALVLLSAGNAAAIARQAREIGITAQFVGTRPIERPELLEAAKFTNGLIYTYPSYNRNHPMIAQYTKSYGAPPTIFGVEAFDAFNSLVTAAQKGNHSLETLFSWYEGRTYFGALGEVHFDKMGDAHYPYMYKEISDSEFKTASFQYELLLNSAKQEIISEFKQINAVLNTTASALAKSGLAGEKADLLLNTLYEESQYAYDVVTVDTKGIITNVYPKKYQEVVGQDISSQPQIVQLHKSRKPIVSEAIQTVEGFLGIDIEVPVFDLSDKFTGSVSVLISPDFFNQVISQKVSNFPIEFWIMQKDGTIVFDDNSEEIGLNIFTSEIYAEFHSLIDLADTIVQNNNGSGEYSFLDNKLSKTIEKKVIWTTFSMYDTEFRLALAHVKGNL